MGTPQKTDIPEGMVQRDDGCICPAPEKPPCPPRPCCDTCGYDPRFPNTNQTNHCFMSFVDYQRCARLLGDYPGCKIFYNCYMALCPAAWIEKWFTQMEKGTFCKRIYPPKPIIRPDPSKMKTVCLDPEEEPTLPVC